jgi:hypothetical protein
VGLYSAASRKLQDRFDTRRLADRIEERIVHDRIDDGDPLLADYPEAQLIVRVNANEVFPNCPRYIHEYKLVKRSRFVPKAECETPVPRWKQSDWAHDVLPENDPANDPSREVIPRG